MIDRYAAPLGLVESSASLDVRSAWVRAQLCLLAVGTYWMSQSLFGLSFATCKIRRMVATSSRGLL